MGFSAACQNQSQEPTLFLILICRVISAKNMWCGGHVWHLAVRVGELVWLQIMPFVCRFVDLSEVADPALWSLSPTTDWNRQGRKAFLMTPPEFWLTLPVYIWMACFKGWDSFFFGARWNSSTIKLWCWGFSFLKIKVAVLALLVPFPRFVWENLGKNRSWGKRLALDFWPILGGPLVVLPKPRLAKCTDMMWGNVSANLAGLRMFELGSSLETAPRIGTRAWSTFSLKK